MNCKELEQNERARELLVGKLEEMAQLTPADFEEEAAYNGCCSVMAEIYQALTKDKS